MFDNQQANSRIFLNVFVTSVNHLDSGNIESFGNGYADANNILVLFTLLTRYYHSVNDLIKLSQ